MSQSGNNSPATWFVTGASRGFGRELTEQLLARGDRVAATLARRSRQHMAEPGTPEERFLKLFFLAEESA